MLTFIALINFTEQGIKKFKETAKRADAFVKLADQVDAKVQDIYWTVGAYDGVVVFEAPDEGAAAALLLALGAQGNVHTQTLRAFTRQEIEAIVSKAPKG